MADTSVDKTVEPRLRAVKTDAQKRGSEWAALAAVLEKHRGKKLLVALVGYPDPDNIGSGLALQFLARQFDIDTALLSFHEVSHQENRALVKGLELDLWLYEDRTDLSEFEIYALVDTQRTEATPIETELRKKALVAVVDHHKRCNDLVAEFIDVREEAGSTCGIFAEYIEAAMPEGLDSNEPEHVKLATALMHGIRADTVAFLEACQQDYAAAAYLWPAVDQSLLRKISAQSLSPAVMDMIQSALERRRVYDNFLFSDVGFVRKENRDGIPQAADFLLTRAGIDTVLVFGVVNGRSIEGSLRTRSDTINPDAFLKKAFGIDEEKGSHYGGGNVRDKGAFRIPIGFLAQHNDREQLYRLACEIIHEKFLEAIGQETDS